MMSKRKLEIDYYTSGMCEVVLTRSADMGMWALLMTGLRKEKDASPPHTM